jgi:hypothetical protein
MKITKNELKQIIEEELTTIAMGESADIGRDMNRIKHTNPDSVAKELALLAKDLDNMKQYYGASYSEEATSLRSWAAANDLGYALEEGELEEAGETKRPRTQADTRRMDLERRGVDGPEYKDLMTKQQLARLNRANRPKKKRK